MAWMRFQQGFLNKFKGWLRPPIFEDPEKTRRAKNLNTILLSLLVVFVLYSLYPIIFQETGPAITAFIILIILVGMLALLRKGYVQLIGVLLTTVLWMAITIAMGVFGGIRNSGFATIIVAVIVANLTLGIRSGITFAGLSILAAIVMAISEERGLLPQYAFEPATTILVSHSLTLVLASLLLYLTIRDLNYAMQTANENASIIQQTNNELKTKSTSIEAHARVLERRNITLQTIAEVARLSASIQEEETFLDRISHLLSTKFSFEHVGIYIIDDREEFLFLRAANDAAGKELINNQHSLPVTRGEFLYGMTVEVPWLNYQIGDNRYQIFAPIRLTDIKSNISFPLTVRSRLSGLLNIQTLNANPTTEEIEILQTLADQIAISLENLRLVARLQAQVKEINFLTGRTIQDAWKEIRGGQALGFQYDRLHVVPASELFPARVANQLRTGQSVHYTQQGKRPSARLLAPIIIRGETVGVIGYEEGPDHQWQAEEIAVLETIASRVGLAIENARLLHEARLRAEREQRVSNAASRIRETLDLDTILRTAAQELKQAFTLSEAEVYLTGSKENQAGRSGR